MKRFFIILIAFMVMVVSVNEAAAINISDTNTRRANIIKFIAQSAHLQHADQKKIALVVGNSKYKYLDSLPCALNDARDMDSVLKTAGYQTIIVLDKSLKIFQDSLNEFRKRMTKESICIFYYAGHAAEYLDNNYLYFENSNPQSLEDMQAQTFDFATLLNTMDSKKVKTRIIILDCCRRNPNKGDQVMIFSNGLAKIKAALNASYYIAYGTTPGSSTLESTGRNGYFTEGILKFISNKNDTFDQVITKATKFVKEKSKNKQAPFRITTLDEEFRLYDTGGSSDETSSTLKGM
ncbi:hypothetical protein GFS24_17670 [Chitinophaga sp. SYP-B3965]|uniref:caspase family protein n=1 Tax=Chitinophaga sp. SYP-B3965 TaxID=2663120 RepID=UPI0012997493|nr:caspase family protein [Chitinophaga sp. SYP-B3965]MRG46955.1 hypothetical protein [Chitinophaga sp. SYP-B3965]